MRPEVCRTYSLVTRRLEWPQEGLTALRSSFMIIMAYRRRFVAILTAHLRQGSRFPLFVVVPPFKGFSRELRSIFISKVVGKERKNEGDGQRKRRRFGQQKAKRGNGQVTKKKEGIRKSYIGLLTNIKSTAAYSYQHCTCDDQTT